MVYWSHMVLNLFYMAAKIVWNSTR